MVDIVDGATRSRMMAGIKGKNTKPEIFLRKALYKMGFRYRLNGQGLPGKPDLVFPSRKAVVFVNGCFWHKHECRLFKWPSNNFEFWETKLKNNEARDLMVKSQLEQLGWTVLTIWECELRESSYRLPNAAIDNLVAKLGTVK